MKSYTILESLHFWLCSAVTSSNCPSMQWTHVSSSCHGFPNAEVKGQLSATADRFPLDQATSDTRSRVDTGGAECVCWVVFTAFSTVSARCWFYCRLPELKWFFFFSPCLPTNAQSPLFLPEDNTLPKLTVARFTQPSEVPTGSGHVLSLYHLHVHTTRLSHTWTLGLFSPLSKQRRSCVIAHIQSAGISRQLRSCNPVRKPCNSQVSLLYINHLSFSWKCQFVCENRADSAFCLRGENFDTWKCQLLSSYKAALSSHSLPCTFDFAQNFKTGKVGVEIGAAIVHSECARLDHVMSAWHDGGISASKITRLLWISRWAACLRLSCQC